MRIAFILIIVLIFSCTKDNPPVNPSSNVNLNLAPCSWEYNRYAAQIVGGDTLPKYLTLDSIFWQVDLSFGYSSFQIGLYDSLQPECYSKAAFYEEPATGIYLLRESVAQANEVAIILDACNLPYYSVNSGDSVYVENNDSLLIVSFCSAKFTFPGLNDTVSSTRRFKIVK